MKASALAAGLLLALTLGACGAQPGGPAADPTATPPPTPTSAPAPTPTESLMESSPASPEPAPGDGTRLTISLQESSGVEPVEYLLECVDGRPGPASTLPNAGAACAVVAGLGVKFFTAVPDRNLMCTEIYGGPQTAQITGTVDGTPVRARFARTNGCEISRWDAVKEILGTGGAF